MDREITWGCAALSLSGFGEANCFSFKFVEAHVFTDYFVFLMLPYDSVFRIFIGVDQLLYTRWIGCQWFNMQ